MIKNYRLAKVEQREALRCGLLDAASRLLVSEGLEALTMRRIAEEVQASTQVLYTLFGNKEGLFEGLYREGFDRLRQQLEAVPPSAPLDRLLNLGRAYREFGQSNPTYFAVLFSQVIPGFTPSPEIIQEAGPILEVFAVAIQDCMEAEVLAKADVSQTAKVIFAAIHGVISLELIGYLKKQSDQPELSQQIFELTMSSILKGLAMT